MLSRLLKSTKSHLLKFAPLAVMFSIVGDVLTPFAPFSLYIFIASVVFGIIILFIYIFKSNLRDKFRSPLIFFVALFLCSGILNVSAIEDEDNSGTMAQIFPPIERLQKTLGIVQKDIAEIKESTKRIEENTKQNIEETKKVVEAVQDSTKQIVQSIGDMQKEFSSLSQSGGIIENPTRAAQFYHNARILQQRGEVDLAMLNYEQALAQGFLFVDALEDLIKLATSRYGTSGSKIYFENKLKSHLSQELQDIGDLLTGKDAMGFVKDILDGKKSFSPFLASWFGQTWSEWEKFDTMSAGLARTIAGNILMEDYNSGKFQTFYIDKIRGATEAEKWIKMHKSMLAENVIDRYSITRASTHFRFKKLKTMMDIPSISDKIDFSKSIIFCARFIDDEEPICKDLRSEEDMGISNSSGTYAKSGASLEWASGMQCAVSISYTDINGMEVKTPILVNHEMRENYRNDEEIVKIKDCAGEYYRPRK